MAGLILLTLFLFLIPNSLLIKCHHCVENNANQRTPKIFFPGFTNFRIPTEPNLGFPDIPTKPCGKLGKDMAVNCSAPSRFCFKIVDDNRVARTCGLDKQICDVLKGCFSCNKDACNNSPFLAISIYLLILSVILVRISG